MDESLRNQLSGRTEMHPDRKWLFKKGLVALLELVFAPPPTEFEGLKVDRMQVQFSGLHSFQL